MKPLLTQTVLFTICLMVVGALAIVIILTQSGITGTLAVVATHGSHVNIYPENGVSTNEPKRRDLSGTQEEVGQGMEAEQTVEPDSELASTPTADDVTDGNAGSSDEGTDQGTADNPALSDSEETDSVRPVRGTMEDSGLDENQDETDNQLASVPDEKPTDPIEMVLDLMASEGHRPDTYILNGLKHICYGNRIDSIVTKTAEECIELFVNDVKRSMFIAKDFVGEKTWEEMGARRQGVVTEMAYMMGPSRLAQFEKMQEALQKGEWQIASREIGNSLLSIQVGNERVHILMERML